MRKCGNAELVPRNPDYAAAIRESFARQTLVTTMGVTIACMRGAAALGLFTLALIGCTACFGFGVERIVDAPDGSYTPARWRVTVDGQSQEIDGARITPAFFASSGIQPLLGRLFVEPEYQSGKEPVGILAHRYWTERFGSTPTIIGSTLEVNGRSIVIVGVAPPGFEPQGAGELWLPTTSEPGRIEKQI